MSDKIEELNFVLRQMYDLLNVNSRRVFRNKVSEKFELSEPMVKNKFIYEMKCPPDKINYCLSVAEILLQKNVNVANKLLLKSEIWASEK